VVNSIRMRQQTVWSSVCNRKISSRWRHDGTDGGVPAANLSLGRVERTMRACACTCGSVFE
jgi:hypothetical protein